MSNYNWQTCDHEYKPDINGVEFCRHCGNDRSLLELNRNLSTSLAKALDNCNALRAALEFYADEDRYDLDTDAWVTVWEDKGATARRELAALL